MIRLTVASRVLTRQAALLANGVKHMFSIHHEDDSGFSFYFPPSIFLSHFLPYASFHSSLFLPSFRPSGLTTRFEGIVYHHLSALDASDTNLLCHLEAICQQIHSRMELCALKQESVMVHCIAGMSRGATITMVDVYPLLHLSVRFFPS